MAAQVLLKVIQWVCVTHTLRHNKLYLWRAFKKTKSGLRSRPLSTLTGPRRPSVPRPTLTSDWHAWSYITSSDSPDATSSAELSAQEGCGGESLCPQTKSQNNPSVSSTHLFWIPPFYPFASIPSATRAALMTYSTEKKRQLPSDCVCVDLWVPLKENYGWQQEERRGERMWEGQRWFGTKAAGERWPSLAGRGRTLR